MINGVINKNISAKCVGILFAILLALVLVAFFIYQVHEDLKSRSSSAAAYIFLMDSRLARLEVETMLSAHIISDLQLVDNSSIIAGGLKRDQSGIQFEVMYSLHLQRPLLDNEAEFFVQSIERRWSGLLDLNQVYVRGGEMNFHRTITPIRNEKNSVSGFEMEFNYTYER